MAYNLINLPAQIDSGSIMKAGYTYLSDGTKARALDASGVGYDYLGSFTYTHDANNNTTLESVSFGGGRVRKNGSGYDVDYYITDHLGSVRAIVNASGTITEQNDYYPFGTRHPNGLTTLSGNRWRFSGKEEQDAAFGVPYSDFGARLYDRTAWTAIDPLAEKYYAVSPYAYCHNNPAGFVDPNGKDDYEFDFTGNWKRIINDDPYDRLISGEKSLIVKNKAIMAQMETHPYNLISAEGIRSRRQLHYSIFDDNPEEYSVFKFLADNTSVEWLLLKGRDGRTLLGTQHLSDKINESNLSFWTEKDGIFIFNEPTMRLHNHPPGYRSELSSMEIDEENYKMNKETSSFVYFNQSGNVYSLTDNGPKIDHQWKW